jgi:peroxiredoxin
MTVLRPLHDGLLRAAKREQRTRRAARRRLVRGTALLGATLARSATAVAATQVVLHSDHAEVGKLAPRTGYPLRVAGGGRTSLDRYRGQVVLVTFWAAWCLPCTEQAPAMQRVSDDLNRRGLGTGLLVSVDDAPRDIAAFLARERVTMPVLEPSKRQLAALRAAYALQGVPETFVLDARGEVTAIHRGQVDEAWMRRAVAKALSESTPGEGTAFSAPPRGAAAPTATAPTTSPTLPPRPAGTTSPRPQRPR